MPTRWVSVTPVAGVRATSGSGGSAPLLTEVERRADAVEVALHRLVDALGERQVGHRVVDVEQRRRPRRRSRQLLRRRGVVGSAVRPNG